MVDGSPRAVVDRARVRRSPAVPNGCERECRRAVLLRHHSFSGLGRRIFQRSKDVFGEGLPGGSSHELLRNSITVQHLKTTHQQALGPVIIQCFLNGEGEVLNHRVETRLGAQGSVHLLEEHEK